MHLQFKSGIIMSIVQCCGCGSGVQDSRSRIWCFLTSWIRDLDQGWIISLTLKTCSWNQGCGSGLDLDSATLWIWIRIPIGNPDPGARKLRNFSGKIHFLVIFKKTLPLKSYKIALTIFWTKFLWITPLFFIWFDSNFDFKQIWEQNCLRKFCFSLDPDPEPDPDWAKMLDPDPY
jgi:hypothetical protein